MEQLSLTTDRLVLDPSNARRMRDKDSLASLKASILALGIIQPITVRPPDAADRDLGGDRYRVFAGGRRLSAVTELIIEGKLPLDYELPALVKNVDDTGADEMSLAENILRRNMLPVDEFKAFSRLAEQGMSAEDIALHFGQTVKFVRGRMALGNLHPVILAAFENEELTWSAVTAYTIAEDRDAQLQTYEGLEGYQKNHAHYIRQKLSGSAMEADNKVAKFIGEEAYRAAGGVIQEDLFQENRYWTSSQIIEDLKLAKLEQLRSDYLADGWSFFKTLEEMGCQDWELRSEPAIGSGLTEEQIDRLDELGNIIETLYDGVDPDELSPEDKAAYKKTTEEYDTLEKVARVYTSEQKSQLGVVLDSYLKIRVGVLEVGKAAKSDAAASKAEKDPLALSAPTLSELGKAATTALAQAVEAQPDKALALLAALLELAPTSPWQQHRPGRLSIGAPGVTAGNANYGLAAKRSFSEAFEEYAAMKAVDLKKALARLVAGAVDISQEWLPRNADMRVATLDAFGVDPTPHFDVDSFFTAGRKPIIAAAYKEMTGQDLKDGKKGDMVAIAVDAAKKTGWLPEYLRTATYKPKKAK